MLSERVQRGELLIVQYEDQVKDYRQKLDPDKILVLGIWRSKSRLPAWIYQK